MARGGAQPTTTYHLPSPTTRGPHAPLAMQVRKMGALGKYLGSAANKVPAEQVRDAATRLAQAK